MTINFVAEPEIFEHKTAIADRIIYGKRELPELMFKEQLTEFLFIDFHSFFSRKFFERLKLFLAEIGEKNFNLLVLKPDPKEYFYHHFGKYPLIEFSIDDSADNYLEIINRNPNDSPADAIIFNAIEVIFFSDSNQWAIYGDRDYELGIIALHNKEIQNKFISAFGKDNISNTKTAIDEILENVFVNVGIPQELKEKLLQNYKSF